MKRSSTAVTVIVAAAVLLASLGIGLCIREVRLRHESIEPGSASTPGDEPVVTAPRPERPGRRMDREISAEDREKLKQQRAEMMERMANMSEEEKEAFRAQMRERFSRRPQRGARGFRDLPPDEAARFRERWENMSEEERQAFRARMRERFNAQRRRERPAPGGPAPEEDKPQDETEKRSQEQDATDEQ